MLVTLCCYTFGFDFDTVKNKLPTGFVTVSNLDTAKSFQPQSRVQTIEIAIKGGGHMVNMNFNKGHSGLNSSLEAIWKSGFLLGGFPLSNCIYLTQEYLISRVRGRYQPYGADYILDYIALPVLVQIQVRPKLRLATGPQLELLLQGIERNNGKAIKITQLTEERSIGAIVDVNYRHSERLGVNGRFMHGLNHIGLYQRADRREFKFEQVQISIAFGF